MARILFVSHDAERRGEASRALTAAGWDVVVVAHEGHASLACVEGPPFDLLVVPDGEMPGADGGALAVRLRRYCPELRLVRMTARHFTADTLVETVVRAAGVAMT